MGPFRGGDKVRAVVDIAPANEVTVCSPISGDPDINSQQSLSSAATLVTGFLLPRPGIVTEVHMITQGNNGSGINRKTRYSICDVEKETSGLSPDSVGLKIRSTLKTAQTNVSDNFNGDVTLASGLAVQVPPQFVIALKSAAFAGNINVQNTLSAGPIPGVVGIAFNNSIVSAATYKLESLDTSNPPSLVNNGETIITSGFKGISVYIRWKAQ